MRHKKFLKQLERQKNVERAENLEMLAEKENKTAKFKEAAARQRTKIKGLNVEETKLSDYFIDIECSVHLKI